MVCGMRHPTSGLSEDDLSRLTGTSNNTSSSLSTSTNDNDNDNIKSKNKLTEEIVDISSNPSEKKSSHSYLPDIIDPNDWPKSSRKRKERHDSTSSNTQDRKLVRSNSEEILQSNDGRDAIRRVSSSEDFKQPLHEVNENTERSLNTIKEHDSREDSQQSKARLETSPARSRHAPSRRYKDSDEMEYENERRRSSERFCKSRAQSGRKGVVKRFGIIPKYRNDENVYNAGFVSQFNVEERGTRKEEAAEGEKLHDYNDNNLIDFHVKAETSAEELPWHTANSKSVVTNEEQPVLSRRFEHMDETESESAPKIITDNEPVKSFRTFNKMENFKTREMMQKRDSKDAYESPDDRLKAVNKKLLSLKKRLTVCEENYEKKTGYRPSQLDKYNDKHIKSIMSEINKLKKEKQEIKADPLSAMGIKQRKFCGDDIKVKEGERLEMIRDTLSEIEKKLLDKREECNRSNNLDLLTAEQLVIEKTSVQHALLYFESMYGRPNTKDERDLARNLYERYRLLKRMVARSVQTSSLGTFGTELPTIMENEQLIFTSETTTVTPLKNSPESGSPNETRALLPIQSVPTPIQSTLTQQQTLPDYDDDEEESTTTTTEETATAKQKPQQSSALFGEKIQNMSVDELWTFLDTTRDEKREVKRTIREFESLFEEQNGRKMLKHDRVFIEETYSNYKELKAKVRLLQALVRKHISH
ncbi:FAM13A family protein [Megaselia abdita]